jgi:AhpD family alkylhydroperoxidase
MRQRASYETLAAEGMKALGGVHEYVARCGLEKTLVDFVYLRVSQINGCAYGIDAHTHDLLQECVSVEQVMLVSAWREAGACFCAREQAALAWAEVVTLVAKTHAPDVAYEAAVSVFGEKELADLTIAIGLINTYNRIAIGFRKVPESVRPLAS